MKKIIVVVMVVILIIAGGLLLLGKKNPTQQMKMEQTTNEQSTPTGSQSALPANEPVITIQNFAYSPSTVTIKVGDTLVWKNEDSVGHSATADDKSFDTGVLSQGQAGSVTFKKAGTYTYHCSVHPNMHGTVVVQ